MPETKKNNTILVPTDFSEVAENALTHAIMIAKKYGNEIMLLHIIESSGISSIFGSKNSIKDGLIGQMLMDKINQHAADISKEHGVKVTTAIREGKIYATVLDVAGEIDCDSIVMGTNGADGLRQIIGSNSSRVIAQSEVPVVVVKEKPATPDGYKNIVLPIDLTTESKQKVWWAIHLAKKFNSQIHIIIEEEHDEFLKSKAAANAAAVETAFRKEGVSFQTMVLSDEKYPGNFADDTIQYAEEIDADLIMIMTQQEKDNFTEYILGSYAQQIVNRHSNVPVMCIVPRNTGLVPQFWSGI